MPENCFCNEILCLSHLGKIGIHIFNKQWTFVDLEDLLYLVDHMGLVNLVDLINLVDLEDRRDLRDLVDLEDF